jgi:hypothetical protein
MVAALIRSRHTPDVDVRLASYEVSAAQLVTLF